MRKLRVLILAAVLFILVWQTVQAQSDDILVLEIEGPVTPAMASYFERGIESAESSGATAVLVVLDTPGGNLDPTQEIVQIFRGSDVPVIMYIGPRGAQAASAGAILTIAAHAAGMAPETVIGAASPVGDGGVDLEETIFRKLTEDMKAMVRGLAERRGPEAVALAEEMIDDARAVSANEALEIGIIDAVAEDVPDLLAQLDGLEVMIDNQAVTLDTAAARRQIFEMTWFEQVLHALANPALVSVLLAIGLPAILIELYNPGGWVTGFIGVLALGLGLYGAGQLPVNWLGLGLIAVAFVLFIAEVFATNHGALGVTGAITMLIGLLIMFNSPGSPEFVRVPLGTAVGVSLSMALFFIFIATKALRAQQVQASTGVEGLVGQKGPARTSFKAPTESGPFTGTVLVNGEIWRAEADAALGEGEVVSVTEVDGFTLRVTRHSG